MALSEMLRYLIPFTKIYIKEIFIRQTYLTHENILCTFFVRLQFSS